MTLPRRKPIRLKGYDYSTDGVYFITICVQDYRCILSKVCVGEGLAPPAVCLTEKGKLAEEQLGLLSGRFPAVTVDKYVIMPNHIHLLLRIRGQTGGASPSPTVSTIIGTFKSLTTRLCEGETKLFQRSFHDHIVRDEPDYLRIWTYIDQNPAKRKDDCFYMEEERGM